MNRDEIIRLAREAGLQHEEAAEEFFSLHYTGIYLDDLERFAALVAAAEREACEKVASDYADYQRSLGDEYAELRAMGALEVMDRISARGEQE